ncbi:MAG: hypothetical protein ACYCZT_02875 [Thiobacillus sp.]
MDAYGWGYVIGALLMIFLFFLIFLGLLALIPPLRQRFALRNVLAWLISSLFIGYALTVSGKDLSPLVIASLFCALLVTFRYLYVTRKKSLSSLGS